MPNEKGAMPRAPITLRLSEEQQAALDAYIAERRAKDPLYEIGNDHRAWLMRGIGRKDLAAPLKRGRPAKEKS